MPTLISESKGLSLGIFGIFLICIGMVFTLQMFSQTARILQGQDLRD